MLCLALPAYPPCEPHTKLCLCLDSLDLDWICFASFVSFEFTFIELNTPKDPVTPLYHCLYRTYNIT